MALFRACQNPPYARPDRHLVFSRILVVSSFLFENEDSAVIISTASESSSGGRCTLFSDFKRRLASMKLSTNGQHLLHSLQLACVL